MNVFDRIDTMFDEHNDQTPPWAQEILAELKEIKEVTKQTQNRTKKIDKNYYRFVKEFRTMMQADITAKIYPKVRYKRMVLGVDFNGLLYGVKSHRALPKADAFDAYYYFYENRENLEILR